MVFSVKILSRRYISVFLNILCILFIVWVRFAECDSVSLRTAYEQGLAKFSQQNYKGAVADFEKALKIFPQFSPAYYHLGLAHSELGSSKATVIGYFKKAIEHDAQHAQAYNSLSKIFYSMSQFDKAEEYALKAIEIDPNLIAGYLSLGWINLLGRSDPPEAIYYFEQVVDKASTPYVYLGLGMAYFMNKQNSKVLGMVTTLRELGQENLAIQLETMIRDKRYVAPKQVGQPLMLPNRSQSSVLVKDDMSLSTSSSADMPVRLGRKITTPTTTSPVSQSPAGMTAAERIRALQQNKTPKGSY